MPVYVDNMFGRSQGKWAGGGHLVADTLDELLAFAKTIGLKAGWLQGIKEPRPHPHFDLTSSKRIQAIRVGAVPIGAREAAKVSYICGGNPPSWCDEQLEVAPCQ